MYSSALGYTVTLTLPDSMSSSLRRSPSDVPSPVGIGPYLQMYGRVICDDWLCT